MTEVADETATSMNSPERDNLVEEILAWQKAADEGRLYSSEPDPQDFVLILSQDSDPEDYGEYWIYDIKNHWLFQSDNEEEQKSAVEYLRSQNRPVVTEMPNS